MSGFVVFLTSDPIWKIWFANPTIRKTLIVCFECKVVGETLRRGMLYDNSVAEQSFRDGKKHRFQFWRGGRVAHRNQRLTVARNDSNNFPDLKRAVQARPRSATRASFPFAHSTDVEAELKKNAANEREYEILITDRFLLGLTERHQRPDWNYWFTCRVERNPFFFWKKTTHLLCFFLKKQDFVLFLRKMEKPHS